MSVVSVMARRVLAGIILLGTILASHKRANATGVPSTLNVQAQTACEAEMLGRMDAGEVFSGKAYDVLKKVARAYGRPVPHIYTYPGEWNMAYIAASTAVDGRGKIVVGQQAIELFNNIALKGFLGHEMAHLVSDSTAEGCNDYVVRDPQVETDADALAARTLGRRPVKAFLKRVLVLTERQNLDAKHRLEVLQRFQLTKSSGIPTTSLGPLRSDLTSTRP
jgi:Zn-dependent protease with chaperone function